MKHWMLAIALFGSMALIGCNKKGDDALIETGAGTGVSGESAPDSGGGESGTSGGEATQGTSAPIPGLPSTNGGSAVPGGAPTANPALTESGEIVKKEAGKPAPDGRVWCDSCSGHLPKEDAVKVNGKTLCMACAEEAKR